MTRTTYIFKRKPDVRFACRITSRLFFGWLISGVEITRRPGGDWVMYIDWHKPRYPRLYSDVGFVDSLRFASLRFASLRFVWLHLWRKLP